ncbi:MAG TPA: CPBP family intramembrane metalloprotease [Anaerolineae bacterium]|nr:CPBP family intramembrane metalloprotease [Anaerolineae bacterium]
MKPDPMPPPRSSLARIFISSDEPRPRTGWRLVLHAVLTFIILSITGALVILALIALGSTPTGEDALSSPLFNMIPLVAILLATWIARRRLDRRSFRSLGFNFDRHTLIDLGFGILLPALLFALILAVEWGMGWIEFQGWAWETIARGTILRALLIDFSFMLSVGIQEEVLSRGYHLQNLAEALNLHWGIFISSAIFALLHISNPHASLASTLGILASGYFLAFGWVRTRNLWLPIGLHIGWNFFQGSIFGFPVSGLRLFGLMRLEVNGPELITGGDFGPEAGLVVLPALALGAFLIWAYTRSRLPQSESTDAVSS